MANGGCMECALGPWPRMATLHKKPSCVFGIGTKEILFDIADDHRSFPAFEEEVKRFFNEPDEEEERRWANALTAIRTGNCTIPAPFSDLPRHVPKDRPTYIEVERLDVTSKCFTPSDNVPDSYMIPVAA